MDKKEVVSFVAECCSKHGINLECFDIHYSAKERQGNNGRKSRFVTTAESDIIAKWILLYVKKYNVFIFWKKNEHKRCTHYSVIVEDILDPLNKGEVKKGIEFAWRTQENVYYCKPEDLATLIKILDDKE